LKNSDSIISLVSKILGEPKYGGKGEELEFNCNSPVCRHDNDKFNLAFNIRTNQFHCWKCKYKGFVKKLIKDYGSENDNEIIEKLIPSKTMSSINFKDNSKTLEKKYFTKDIITCNLPKEYKPLWKKGYGKYYEDALNYALNVRKFTLKEIKKFKIGYTESTGRLRYRLIIPSLNKFGKINYYVARSYYPSFKPHYLAPKKTEVAKSEIIFNSKNINFDIPVIMTEGVFDTFPLYNSIPILGTEPAPIIIKELVKYNTKVILCLDEDALYQSMKIYNELTSKGLKVFYVDLKGDIDSFYRQNGKDELVKLLLKARDIKFQNLFQNFVSDNKLEFEKDFVDELSIRKKWNLIKQNT
jgi:hypothetical protein